MSFAILVMILRIIFTTLVLYFLVYLLFDYKNTIIVGNDTELIKLRDKVKTEKEFKLIGEYENTDKMK